MADTVGDRALVLGAGMAGLLAARVLAESYTEVVVVERDTVTGVQEPRRGVPQGRHAHALLARGQQILDELFPGIREDFTAAGIPVGDLVSDLRWYFNGRRLRPRRSGLLSVSATRPQLEAIVRARVATLPNVAFREGCSVHGFETADGGRRVTGVRLRGAEPGEPGGVLGGDLVVDATGRGTRTPAWLAELGLRRPEETRVQVDLAYTTRRFRLAGDPYGTDLSINPVAHPGNPRGAFFPRLSDGSSMLSLTGLLGDHPPADAEGFLDFARSLAAPEIPEALRTATPLDEPVAFRFPASVRRHYERLPDFPAGLLVIGDAACSFNPVYGQGMTVAALEATALRERIALDGRPRADRYFRRIAEIIDTPWTVSVGADLAFPGVRGPRTAATRIGNAYLARLHRAAARDARVTESFFRVAGLIDPPSALMRPGLMWRVLRPVPVRPPAHRPAAADRAAEAADPSVRSSA